MPGWVFFLGGEGGKWKHGENKHEKKAQVAATKGFPKMLGFPNWPMGFPTKNDGNFGL